MTRLALALALPLLLAAPASASPEGVLEELDAWDMAAARKAAEAYAAQDPGSALAKTLMARVLFEEGDYPGAVKLLDELGNQAVRLGQEDFAAVARSAAKLTAGYESQESAHFVFRYPKGKDAVLAPYALETLEKIRAALAQDLGYSPPNRVVVEVYDDVKALSKVSTLPLEAIKTSGTIAICKFNRLMITSPKALVRGYEWQDTLAHEYVHLVVSKKSRNEVPIWIHEGLAKYLESRWRGAAGQALHPSSAGLLAAQAKSGELIPFERMHPSMALLPSQEDAALAFAEVFTAIEYLHGKAGNEGLIQLVEELKGGAQYQAAVSRVMGVPFARFEADWKAYLARREYPEAVASLDPEKLKFREDAPLKKPEGKTKKERDEIRFGDFLEIKDPEGRKLAHLGELLRTRKRYAAAAEEFARAYGKVGDRSPVLSNKYAETLVKLERLPEAEKLLRASLEPYPSFPRTCQNLADVLMATKRPDEAEKYFLEVVSVDPFDPTPHAGLLAIYQARKDEARAGRERKALRILAGQDAEAAEKGSIVVTSKPFARVFLDGQDTGRSTPTTLEVMPGSHVVKLVNQDRGLEREQGVEVGAGEEKAVEVDFGQAAP